MAHESRIWLHHPLLSPTCCSVCVIDMCRLEVVLWLYAGNWVCQCQWHVSAIYGASDLPTACCLQVQIMHVPRPAHLRRCREATSRRIAVSRPKGGQPTMCRML